MLIRNHLNFRITACKCIEKFRNLQAFSLNEVQNSYVYRFNEVSKSSAVLQFDTWNTWVQFLETRLLEHGVTVDNSMAKVLVNTARKTYGEYLTALDNHPEHFPKKFVTLHTTTNRGLTDRFLSQLHKVEGKSIIDAMVFLVKALEKYLQSGLFELQEVDYLIFQDCKKPPFISIDQQDLNEANSGVKCSALKRFETYRKQFEFSRVVVKSYIEGPCNLDEILDPIKMTGVTIDQVRY